MSAAVPFLSAEWCQLARDLAHTEQSATAPVPAATGYGVCHVVAGTPQGEVRYLVTVTDGRISDVAPLEGKDDGGAGVTLTTTFEQAVALAKGEKNPSVLFMQGTLKTAGDPGLVLQYLRLLSQPGALATTKSLATRTSFAA